MFRGRGGGDRSAAGARSAGGPPSGQCARDSGRATAGPTGLVRVADVVVNHPGQRGGRVPLQYSQSAAVAGPVPAKACDDLGRTDQKVIWTPIFNDQRSALSIS